MYEKIETKDTSKADFETIDTSKNDSFMSVERTDKLDNIKFVRNEETTPPVSSLEPFPSYDKYKAMSREEKIKVWNRVHVIVEYLVDQKIDPFCI